MGWVALSLSVSLFSLRTASSPHHRPLRLLSVFNSLSFTHERAHEPVELVAGAHVQRWAIARHITLYRSPMAFFHF